MFTARGRFHKREVSVTWTEHVGFTGEAAVVAALRREAIVLEDVGLGWPEGPYSERDHEQNALGALVLCEMILDQPRTFSGAIPTREQSGY